MRRIGAFAVFVLLVAGCTSSADPGPPHTGSAPPSTPATTPVATASTPSGAATPTIPADVPTTGPNTNPGEKPPLEPAAATAHTAAGAKAFAVFFIKTIDWGYATTSAAYMRHFFQPSCVECRSAADAIDRDAKKKRHFIGDRFTIRRVQTLPPRGAESSVVVHFDASSVEVVDSHRRYVDGEPALTDFRERIYLSWTNGAWTVAEMVPES